VARAGYLVRAMAALIPFLRRDPVVPVLRLSGVIAQGGRPGTISDATYGPLIDRAFRGKPKAVVLVINSPGGSPAQSSLVAARIRRLADEKKVPVLAFVEDVAASGGYWLATAADEILVDATSIVGSIGVISAGFGFPALLDRWGVERRVYTAGRSKSQLDPFRPENPEDVARLDDLLAQLHETFIAQVKARRGAKLAADADLFTGEVFIGARAVELGLADGVAHLEPEVKARFGDRVRLVRYGVRRPLFGRLGLSLAEGAMAGIEDRALWARYGL
jgi:serine protease SohB